MRIRSLALAIVGAGAAFALATSMTPAYAASSGDSQKAQLAQGLAGDRTQVIYLNAGPLSVRPGVTAHNGHISAAKNDRICPHNGKCGNLRDSFYSRTTGQYCIDYCFEIQYHVTDGTVWVKWLGNKPYNASSMNVTSAVWVGGVGVSVNVSGVTGTDAFVPNGVQFSHGYPNTWRVETAFNSIYFTTALEMWGPYQNETGTANFTWQQFNNVIS
jgi:hypothetical protein